MGDTFVDVGANIGFYTVLAANSVGKLGKVLAVEMFPPTMQMLYDNIHLNHLENVEVAETALWDMSGSEVIANAPTGKFGQASIQEYGKHSTEARVTTTIYSKTLDEVCRGLTEIHLMKIDVEGSEEQVIKGGERTLGKTKCVVFEDLTRRGLGCPVTSRLNKLGFRVETLDPNNKVAWNKNR
ncbi:FkbM family methyltransferase [Rhodopirellula halodulae]|uniref:FkbM family methyltransferase n=1 Tax=Rhodopirellula halodulae TaxID=2894198 RepID=UPI001E56A801|nr:FkbM family methyltransferase [Rhodopirellula sp. JC737]